VTRGLQGVTMQKMRAVFVAVFAVVSVLLFASAGCSSSSAGVQCQPGQPLKCSCQGMFNGTAQCDSSGHPLECQCGGGSGSSSGSTSSGGSSGGTGSSSGGTEEGGSSGGDATTEGGGVGDAGAG
jgi:hypothetical protein